MKMRYLLCAIFAVAIISPVANTFADVQDFYFSDFTADYYLTKQDDGTSSLHVKEVITAIFPETNQNHGITRLIPSTNQNGKNQTVDSEAALNLKVLRNGEPENINKIAKEKNYYIVYIGSASKYVHGEQKYTLEYDFTNVITEFTESGQNVSGVDDVKKAFQELYWDTNGTGWSQRFDRITARLHVPNDVYSNLNKQAWCYVGAFGSHNQDRCIVKTTNDGFSFTTGGLSAGENLTFVTNFQPDTFKVIIKKYYFLVWLLVAEIVIFAIIIIKNYVKWSKKAKSQYHLRKSLFEAPQYQPPTDNKIHAAEAEQIYLKKTESSYVATLLELVVGKAVTLKRIEDQKKYNWTIVLNIDSKELSGSQAEMLNILNNGKPLTVGAEIPIQKHTPTRHLAECPALYRAFAKEQLEDGGYLQPRERTSAKYQIVKIVVYFLLFYFLFPPATSFLFSTLGGLSRSTNFTDSIRNGIMVGGLGLLIVDIVVFIAAVIFNIVLRRMTAKYQKYTEKGIRLINYLEGLELYIKMAEADRLKFLQSVKGADTSREGIVKLYEKLLPWASLFGAEESWVYELAKYYEVEMPDDAIGTDLVNGLISSNISRDISRVITYSTRYYEPSSSGSGGGGSSSFSSSSSGSGGGGFSGGGGGGGGGGGW